MTVMLARLIVAVVVLMDCHVHVFFLIVVCREMHYLVVLGTGSTNRNKLVLVTIVIIN